MLLGAWLTRLIKEYFRYSYISDILLSFLNFCFSFSSILSQHTKFENWQIGKMAKWVQSEVSVKKSPGHHAVSNLNTTVVLGSRFLLFNTTFFTMTAVGLYIRKY